MDIDSDFHTEIRSQVIDYVKSKYGEKAVCNILTKGRMAGKLAIRNVGRVTNIPDFIVDTAARMVPSTPNSKIADAIGLDDFCSHNPLAKQLVDDAKLVEGVMNNYGMHPAGVIIADNGDVNKYVPLMYNTDKEQWVAQCDMGQTEKDAGLLKMDMLGLRNLDIITDARQRIYENHGTVFDMNNLPLDPDVFREIFCKGNTSSIFQFESSGMRDMLRKFKPTSMEDLILLVAAYRPGPMKYIPDIIAVKRGEKTPVYIADGLKEILDVTYGCTIYQEQVMQIFNKVAGFTLGEADIIRRAMSKKKLEILTDPETDYHGKFIAGMVKAGAKEAEAEAFWDELLDFASYAFNKSHAAAYAVVAYMTAYLKCHYPAEYMCAVMSRTSFEKLPSLITECRRMGIKIMPPDINRSANNFINSDNTIWYGFSGIKGVVAAGAEIIVQRSTPFTSIKDFIYRVVHKNSPVSKDVISNLIEAGAFDVFCDGNRQSLLKEIEPFTEIVKKLKEAQAKYQETVGNKERLEAEGASEKELKKAERAVTTARTKLESYQEAYALHNFVFVPEDPGTRLAREYELLGAYISGNPFDQYVEAAKLVPKAIRIYDIQEGENSTICGIVSNLKVFQRKSDGRPFCSFSLSDQTGDIEVKCFTKEYPKYEDLIQEGTALVISGKARLQDAYGDPEGAPELFVMAKTIEKLNPLRKERIIISGETLLTWAENYDLIYSYEQPDGYECYFNDQSEMVMRRCDFRVSKDILQLQNPSLLISSLSIA